MAYIVVFLGGGLGAALRHGINIALGRMLGAGFPYATFYINVTGSFVMGLIAAWFAYKGDASQHWRQMLRAAADRVGAGEEAERRRLLAHVLAAGREPHHRARHGDARGREHMS